MSSVITMLCFCCKYVFNTSVGPVAQVGITTDYGLDGPG